MSRRRNEIPGCLVGPLFFGALFLFFFIKKQAEEHGLLVWVGAIGTVVLIFKVAEYFKKKQLERQRTNEQHRFRVENERPCQHGIVGAHHNRDNCSVCAAEFQQREMAANAADRLRRQNQWDQWTAKARTPQYLLQIDPVAFEHLVCDLFAAQGYTATSTPKTGDGGIDAFLRKNNRLTLLQCKRVKSSVGEPVLRDLYGAMMANSADDGIVVTTGSVSRQAVAWIQKLQKPIRIIELDELTQLIETTFRNGSAVPSSFEPDKFAAPAELQICPECGNRLRVVKGPYGKFLGCRGYPDCTHRQKIVK